MKRIIIFGKPGSGKSTFAVRLHRATGLPLHHIDRYFFVDNWQERDKQQFLNILNNVVAQDTWIIDGTSVKTLELRYARADVCIFFNLPRWLCLYRIFKRVFDKDRTIKDRPDNCKERVTWKLARYLWGFDARVQPLLEDMKKRYPQVHFIEITSDDQLDDVITMIQKDHKREDA